MAIALPRVLTDEEIDRIHRRSLELLERVGIVYNTPRALDLLAERGCPVDYERSWASLPADTVEWALEQAPRVVRLCGRDPARDVVLDGRRSHHTTDSQGTRAVDSQTGQVRPSTADDLRQGLLLADALERVEIVNVMVAANDIPAHLRTIHHFATGFARTSKPVRSGVLHAGQVPFLVELVRAATGSGDFRPIFSAVDCTISPLMHDGPMTEACIELARLGVPIMVYPMPLAGGTAPITREGTLLLHNTEFLSGLALLQAARPGAPIVYGTGAAQLDMRSGAYANSAAERGLALGLRDMARHYHLPVNLGGLSSASDHLDAQYGFEATSACLLAALAGADEIYSMGLLSNAQTFSPAKMVLDHHLAGQIEAMLQPLQVDEEHLQAELIARVGIGGHYLNQRETRSWMRRAYLPVWPPVGQDMVDIARQEAAQILAQHTPPPLPAGAREAFDTITAAADRELA